MEKLPSVKMKTYSTIRPEIQSGDILLCSGNSAFSNMIQHTTKSMWSHVGFILRLDIIDRIIVLESVESIGVRAVTLGSYVRDYNGTGKGYPGQIMVARHADVKPENIINLSHYATGLLGYPYGTQEILRIMTRISMNNIGLNLTHPDALPTREFICSEFAYVCFKSIGVEVEYDSLGFIAPADFARSPKVKPVNFIHVENEEENYIQPSIVENV